MRYLALLGRQPAISMAELERVFDSARWFSNDSAVVEGDSLNIQRLGGTIKAGQVIMELSSPEWSRLSTQIVHAYYDKWSSFGGKITLGISVYGFSLSPRDIQRTGYILKSQLKSKGTSLRLIPNEQNALSTATSHHNKLGLSLNKVELLIVKGHGGKVIVAESTGSQNITALANRDQARPARDAFVGMLSPKLAQIMLNLATKKPGAAILDPFCGTGVVLQEALLMDYTVYGSDLSPKMIDYTNQNLDWLKKNHNGTVKAVREADAMKFQWSEASTLDAVVCESYLGQPFSAPPSPKKLEEVLATCDNIIAQFLKNIGNQIIPGTQLCVAVPCWRGANDWFTHIPVIKRLDALGYKQIEFKNINAKDLVYFRPEQVVARELLVLEKV